MRIKIVNIIVLSLIVLVVGGCIASKKQWSGEDASIALTPEQARAALLEMIVTSGQKDLVIGTNVIQNAQVEYLAENKVVLGPCVCDMDKFYFVISLINQKIFLEYSGRFELKDGKWTAKLEEERRGHCR